MPTLTVFDAKVRAWLFNRLAQADRVGLPLLDTITTLEVEADRSLAETLARFRSDILAGAGVTEAGLRNGLFLAWETRLIQAAEASGKLGRSYAELARRYAGRTRRAGKLRSGLTLMSGYRQQTRTKSRLDLLSHFVEPSCAE